MITVTAETCPELHRAFVAIEQDNGAHLIGTVYPGEPVDLDHFTIPTSHCHLIGPAASGLARLRAQSEAEWETFVTGEQSEAEAIARRKGDLEEARHLLDDWFNGWCAPETGDCP